MEEIDKNELNKEIGLRLKAARHIYNEGIKLNVEQFAHLLGLSNEKLINYETGRSALPINVLYNIYLRGINPIYILSGDGDILANNKSGNILKNNIKNKKINYISIVDDVINKNNNELNNEIIKVAAGKIELKK